MKIDFDIVTICNKHRKPLLENYLKDIPHITHYTEDYDLPEGWRVNPCYQGLSIFMHQHRGHLRCCYGHRDALLKTTKDYILLLEDDAVPNRNDWFDFIYAIPNFLETFELISVHGREFNKGLFNIGHYRGVYLYVPKNTFSPRRVLGSLAYFVRRDVIQRFVDFKYQGMGQDLFICNCFNFALIDPSPFNHDRVNSKSLIDK